MCIYSSTEGDMAPAQILSVTLDFLFAGLTVRIEKKKKKSSLNGEKKTLPVGEKRQTHQLHTLVWQIY